MDEWLTAHLSEFEGKKLQSISKGNLDLDKVADKEVQEQQEQKAATFADVIKEIKTALGDRVKDVRTTHRLVDSPACVVFDENELSGHMQRLLKSAGQEVPNVKPILELNPDHPLLLKIHALQDPQKISDWAVILLSQALLAEGEQLPDPAGFVKELNRLLIKVSD